MMHFKNHKVTTLLSKKIKKNHGFTLMEAMLSMVIIGMVLTPIFILHGAIMQRMNKSSKQLYALLQGKEFLYHAREKQSAEAQEFVLDKKVEDSQTELKYELHKSVDQGSVLASYEGLHKELVTIVWFDKGQKRIEQLVSYVYKQPEQKKS